MTQARYAIYFAPPPASELWRFGSRVLGYDAVAGFDVPFLLPEPMEAGHWAELTAEPRRYGFHATLKAPFRLARGYRQEQLVSALDQLAESLSAVGIASLSVQVMGRFIVLRPDEDEADVSRLAGHVVDALEPLRAPLTREDLARRKREPLSARQAAYLERYGYPHVHEDFRFHMTLAGPMDPDRVGPVACALRSCFARHVPHAGIRLDALTLFRQDRPSARFRTVHRSPLAGGMLCH